MALYLNALDQHPASLELGTVLTIFVLAQTRNKRVFLHSRRVASISFLDFESFKDSIRHLSGCLILYCLRC